LELGQSCFAMLANSPKNGQLGQCKTPLTAPASEAENAAQLAAFVLVSAADSRYTISSRKAA
jgi:hypothetical protein